MSEINKIKEQPHITKRNNIILSIIKKNPEKSVVELTKLYLAETGINYKKERIGISEGYNSFNNAMGDVRYSLNALFKQKKVTYREVGAMRGANPKKIWSVIEDANKD